METKEQLLAKVAELQAIINKMNQEEPKKFLLDSINGSVQSWGKKPHTINWHKDGELIMYYNRKTKIFNLRYSRIWAVFESEFGLDDKQINELCSGILRKHFNCKVFETTVSISNGNL
jgi:hypothetical protein